MTSLVDVYDPRTFLRWVTHPFGLDLHAARRYNRMGSGFSAAESLVANTFLIVADVFNCSRWSFINIGAFNVNWAWLSDQPHADCGFFWWLRVIPRNDLQSLTKIRHCLALKANKERRHVRICLLKASPKPACWKTISGASSCCLAFPEGKAMTTVVIPHLRHCFETNTTQTYPNTLLFSRKISIQFNHPRNLRFEFASRVLTPNFIPSADLCEWTHE